MTTIKDIAKELKLSISSVSMALNNSHEISEKTKQQVKQKALELNYIPNGSAIDLQRRKTNTILFITEDPTRPYFSEAIKILETMVNKLNLALIISTSNQQSNRASLRFLREQRADAIICWSKFITCEILNQCASPSMPIFVMGQDNSKLINKNIYNISIEKDRVGYEITNYLINYDFRNILFVHNNSESIGSERRRIGFNRAIEKNKFVKGKVINATGNDYNSGYEITDQVIVSMILKKSVDAIIYSTDDMAVGGIQCLTKYGIKVPNDISITGYGNYPISKMILPRLTTVELHEREMMELTTEALAGVLNGKKPEKIKQLLASKNIKSEIIERDSVKKE